MDACEATPCGPRVALCARDVPWVAASHLRWVFGRSLPSVDLKNIKSGMDNLAEDFKASPTLTKGGLALGALAGAGFVLFNEMETVMELIGSIAIARLAFTRLLFADTRRETVGAIQASEEGWRGRFVQVGRNHRAVAMLGSALSIFQGKRNACSDQR